MSCDLNNEYVDKASVVELLRKVHQTDLEMLSGMKKLLEEDPDGEALPREYILDQLIKGKEETIANIEEFIA